MVYKDYSPSNSKRNGDRGRKPRTRSSTAEKMRKYLSALVMGGVPVQGGMVAPPIPFPELNNKDKRILTGTPKLLNGLSGKSFKEAERDAEATAAGLSVTPPDASGGGSAGPDPMDALVRQLYGLASSAPASASALSDADIKKMLSGAGAAGAPYSAQINSLQHMNAGARQDTRRGTKAIQRMYQALARDDSAAGASAVATQKQLAAQINQQAAQGNSENQQRAQALMADNAKYGADVAAELNTDIGKQAAAAQGVTTQRAANFAASALEQGGNFNNYFQQNRSADRAEGSKRASDLITQLQGYLQGNRDKMAELAGQRSAAVASARSSILGQITSAQQDAQKAAYNASQDKFANLLKLVQFQNLRQNQGIDNDRASAKLQADLQKYASQAEIQKQRMAQQSMSGQMSTADLIKLLSANGVYKGKSQNDILKAIQAIMASQQ